MNPLHIVVVACIGPAFAQATKPPEPPQIPPIRSPAEPDWRSVPRLTPEQDKHRETDAARRLTEHGLTLSLIGMGTLPPDQGQLGRIGGLSGLTHLEGNRFLVASDSKKNAAVYELTLGLTPTDAPDRFALGFTLAPAPMKVLHLSTDAESVSMLPGGDGLVIGYEHPPAVVIAQAGSEGEPWQAEKLEVPGVILDDIRDNRGFESVMVREQDSGMEIWAATEAGLKHDGSEATTKEGTRCRVVVFSKGGDPDFSVEKQLIYVTEPSPDGPLNISFNSLSDMCPVPGGRFLALERAFTPLSGFNAKIFILDGSARTPEAAPGDPDPVPVLIKALVANIRDLGVASMGNYEGMKPGPTIAELTGDRDQKGRILLIIEDDNFGSDGQVGSRIVALRMIGLPGDDAGDE